MKLLTGVRATEIQCQDTIVATARAAGWRVHAERAAVSRGGHYATPIQGDAGFPDLVMVRADDLWFVELKRKPNSLEPDQHGWLQMLHRATRRHIDVQVLVVWVPEQQQAFLEQICSRHPDPNAFLYSPPGA